MIKAIVSGNLKRTSEEPYVDSNSGKRFFLFTLNREDEQFSIPCTVEEKDISTIDENGIYSVAGELRYHQSNSQNNIFLRAKVITQTEQDYNEFCTRDGYICNIKKINPTETIVTMASNKVILKANDKKMKATKVFLKVPPDVMVQEKERIFAIGRLINYKGLVELEATKVSAVQHIS